MLDKAKYLNQFRDLHEIKTGKILSEDDTLLLFEKLVTLVDAVPLAVQKYGN
ncbi:MAG: hypothetical protein JWO50_575 [Candidatus Kaiserbacteria bacterium]|nr:hypothetical protein [Candidatus Kaiserbacteria bacterium]